jgi:hypothetical protein
VAEALGDALDCTRVWSAWSYGTMRDADFVNVNSDPERVAEIAAAAVNALAQASALPAAPQGVPPVVREAYEALFGASTLVTTSKMTASRYLEGCPAVLLIRFNSDEAAERAHKALRLLEDAAGGVNPSSAAAYWSATQPATPEPPQASAPSVQVAPHDDENDGLPSWVACSEAVADGGATALQRFIDANEPADLEGAREFRQGLLAVIRGASALQAAIPAQQPADEPITPADVMAAYRLGVRDAIAQPAVEPAGWKLVPVEPTKEMRKACDNGPGAMVLTNSEIYRAMIAAAPVVESEEPVAWVSLSELRWLKLHQHAESAMTSASLSVHRTDFHTTPLYASPTAQPATSQQTGASHE